jgi:hypothetical protein
MYWYSDCERWMGEWGWGRSVGWMVVVSRDRGPRDWSYWRALRMGLLNAPAVLRSSCRAAWAGESREECWSDPRETRGGGLGVRPGALWGTVCARCFGRR